MYKSLAPASISLLIFHILFTNISLINLTNLKP